MNTRRTFLKRTSFALLGLNQGPGHHGSRSVTDPLSHPEFTQTADPFEFIRKSLLVPEAMVYLNTGSLGPATRMVVDRVCHVLHELESNPVGNNWGSLGRQMEEVRAKVAAFIGAQQEEIILTRNTTEGLNLVGSCLDLKAGDEMLTTNHEHGGGENGLLYLAETRGAVVRRIDMPLPARNPEQIIDLIHKAVSERTRVIMLSHVSTVTGLRMPFSQIAAFTRPRNILLIADGAQAPGQIPVDVGQLMVDVYASSGHKWLLGPKETGFLYIREAVQERIRTVFTRGSYQAYSAASGTRNVATIIGLGEALDWMQTLGPEKIEERCRSLAQYCSRQLTERKGLRVISPDHPQLQTGIVSILLDEGFSNRLIFEKMREREIIVKLLPNYNALRFSLHLFTSESDIDRMIDALDRIMQG